MVKELQIRVPVHLIEDKNAIRSIIAENLNLALNDLWEVKVLKQSVDARQRSIYFQLKVKLGIGEYLPKEAAFQISVANRSNKSAVVVGAGPAGLFAAIELLKLGVQPIIIERGKDVQQRRRDLAAINKAHVVNTESNYCFGEGGAGTYSDGKLYTRSNKRGDVDEILKTLIHFGAEPQIAVDAHPHIGTNKLPKIIAAIRSFILDNGGKIYFESKLTDLVIQNNCIEGVIINDEKELRTQHVILATGHSARDIFTLLNKKNILIEAKPFALGVRVEHPQEVIDQNQYNCSKRPDFLPPASYKLVCQTPQKPVFSFCMCPGGIVAPCATAPGEIVTNGWSPSKRNNPYANSGIVVAIDQHDWQKYNGEGALAALAFQKSIEQKAFEYGGGGQVAPAQRLLDFVEGRVSATLPKTSYQPGIKSVLSDEVLPPHIVRALKFAFKDFGKKIPSFLSNDAVIHLTESRTSSPVKIPRSKDSLMHPDIKGLFPCGEGAGYAGGIMSAAIDGVKCARALNIQIR